MIRSVVSTVNLEKHLENTKNQKLNWEKKSSPIGYTIPRTINTAHKKILCLLMYFRLSMYFQCWGWNLTIEMSQEPP